MNKVTGNNVNMFPHFKEGDTLELSDYMGGKPLGVIGHIIDSGNIRIEGYSGSFSLTGGCKEVYSTLFPHRKSDRSTWSFDGPRYWISTETGVSVHDTLGRSSRVRVSRNTPSTPVVVNTPKGNIVFGGGYSPR